jgi:hypothetical protein
MGVKDLMGSLAKDLFKWWHKQIPGRKNWYACDIDFSLLDRNRILCLQDYKNRNDTITWAETKVYKDLCKPSRPIYVIKGNIQIPNDIVMFSRNSLYTNLRSLNIPAHLIEAVLIEAVMNTNIEKTLKTNAMNTMEKDLSVWDYIPDNSKKSYSSKLISNDYIGWEAELRERRTYV